MHSAGWPAQINLGRKKKFIVGHDPCDHAYLFFVTDLLGTPHEMEVKAGHPAIVVLEKKHSRHTINFAPPFQVGYRKKTHR
jgi:hypothetical protein